MGNFLKLINIDFMEGVSEPWCNNQGIVLLPFVKKYSQYWFLLIKEKNPLFKNLKHTKLGSLTGGVEEDNLIETVKKELLEETGIDVKTSKHFHIYHLGEYYANKTNIKLWHFYAVDLTRLNLDISKIYQGAGDGTIGETDIKGEFVNISELSVTNDALTLAAFAQLVLKKIIKL